MSRPTFGEGVLVALLAGIGGAALSFGFSLILRPGAALTVSVTALCFAYLIYLIVRAEVRPGRLTLVVAWGIATLMVWAFSPGIATELLAQVGFLWAARSYCFHRNPSVVLMDLGLAGLGLIAAVWTIERTDSVFLSLWTFFLVQAFFALLPRQGWRRAAASIEGDPFETAERTAERSLQRLALRD